MDGLPKDVLTLIEVAAGIPDAGPVLWLTGAGISAESGIPTFRGREGYWTVGSRHFHPQELATRAAFGIMRREVWSWYLYRRAVCRAARPNEAHTALAQLEREMRDRMLLVTQNVDGLHLRAGSTSDRTYQIHGNIDYMRCYGGCGSETVSVPDVLPLVWDAGRTLTDAELDLLACARCGGPARPHVLWFDETYDEAHFRFESAIEAAMRMPLLVVVGTTGATNLPLHIGALAARRRVPMIVINPEPNPFTEMAERAGSGTFLQGPAGVWVPMVAAALADRFAGS